MLSTTEIAKKINIEKTILVLGSGASIPSGGPSGYELAEFLKKKFETELEGEGGDLKDIATLIEISLGRKALVEAIHERISKLQPDKGMLAIPTFPWKSIYTTNYDTLIEQAYRRSSKPLNVVRSSYEYGHADNGVVTLYKIHGCITKDEVFGDKSKMIITDGDYKKFEKYRQDIFKDFSNEVSRSEVVIVGHSLSDEHLKQIVVDAISQRNDRGIFGGIYLIVKNVSQARVKFYENIGVQLCDAGIDELLRELANGASSTSESGISVVDDSRIPTRLLPVITNINDAISKPPNAFKMVSGGAATFADINASLTFRRSLESSIDSAITSNLIVTIKGVAGVGKTTLARRILFGRRSSKEIIVEFDNSNPFISAEWLSFAKSLADEGKTAIVLVDNASSYLGVINNLIDRLYENHLESLKILITIETSQWAARRKSTIFFERGKFFDVTNLDDVEISGLVGLLSNDKIRNSAQQEFLALPQREMHEAIKYKCSKDPFVAMKYLFNKESIDQIILKEFAQLDEDCQDIYKLVAFLESSGAEVHRQMVLRLVHFAVSDLMDKLKILDGIIFETSPNKKNSDIYLWRTRHSVIANIVSKVKFFHPNETEELVRKLIRTSNPTHYIERKTLVNLCQRNSGIYKIPDPQKRIELLKEIVATSPTDRVPRHRIIKEYLDLNELGLAEQALDAARREAGHDAPLKRYEIMIEHQKYKSITGLQSRDLYAILWNCKNLALQAISDSQSDIRLYETAERICESFASDFNEGYHFCELSDLIHQNDSNLLDPEYKPTKDRIHRASQYYQQQMPHNP